jgi:hypothetical protein
MIIKKFNESAESPKVRLAEYCELEGDCNNYDLYDLFKQHTGIELEFEVGQDYGTGCYGLIRFMDNNPKSTYKFYPTLEELEDKIQKYKDKKLGKYEYITANDIVNYFRRKGILPEKDFLFNVDY